MHWLTDLPAFVFALGVIIFVHELGHLTVAKAFGMRVDTFSLGFGRRLWGFKRGDTDYRVSLIPLGGYVKLAGDQAVTCCWGSDRGQRRGQTGGRPGRVGGGLDIIPPPAASRHHAHHAGHLSLQFRRA